MLKPFHGEATITQEFSDKHTGIDYALNHRTAIFSVYSGQIMQLESNIEAKTKGVKNWIANTDNDPFLKSLGKIIYRRNLTTYDYGNYIKIDHGGGIYSLYAHLDEVVVSEGQWVKQGELIGYSDSTGNSTGGHIHFEIWQNGKRVDPDKFDKANPNYRGVFNALSFEYYVYEAVVPISEQVKDGLFIRSAPTTKASTVKVGNKDYYLPGDKVKVKGFVKGERMGYDTIESTQFWWVTKEDNYIWAGGTSIRPTLDDFPTQLNKRFNKLNNMHSEEVQKMKEQLEQNLADLETRLSDLETREEEAERNFATERQGILDAIKETEASLEALNAPEEEAPESTDEVEEGVVEDAETDTEEEEVEEDVDEFGVEELSDEEAESLYAQLAERLGK